MLHIIELQCYYFIFFSILALFALLYIVINIALGKRYKKYIKKVSKIMLLILMFVFLIRGTYIECFTTDIVVQASFIVLCCFLVYAIVIEKGRIIKFLNAEIKYEDISDTVEYIEILLNKNELSCNLIKYTCMYKENPLAPKPLTIEQAFDLLQILVKDYIDKYDMTIESGGSIKDKDNLDEQCSHILDRNQIWYNEDKKYGIDGICTYLVRDEIYKVCNEIYFIPIIGKRFSEFIVLKGSCIDIFDATFIKNIGRMIY